MKIGQIVRDFALEGINAQGEEKTFSLSDFAGQTVILYFYPKDNTPGCTQEACDFKEKMNRLTSKAVLVGISPDSIKSHQAFREKLGLNYILLSDPDRKISRKFGVWQEKTMYGRNYMGVVRSTFIIGSDGKLKEEWRKVKVKGHVDEVLSFIQDLD